MADQSAAAVVVGRCHYSSVISSMFVVIVDCVIWSSSRVLGHIGACVCARVRARGSERARAAALFHLKVRPIENDE